jgi:predicted lipid-binding transport protein (Tim44 family)
VLGPLPGLKHNLPGEPSEGSNSQSQHQDQVSGLVAGLLVGLVIGLMVGLIAGLVVGLIAGLLLCFGSRLMPQLGGGFVAKLTIEPAPARPTPRDRSKPGAMTKYSDL